MEQSASHDELTIRHQFDCVCKKALKGELIDYQRYIIRRRNHEVLLSEISGQNWDWFWVMDEYNTDNYRFLWICQMLRVTENIKAENERMHR